MLFITCLIILCFCINVLIKCYSRFREGIGDIKINKNVYVYDPNNFVFHLYFWVLKSIYVFPDQIDISIPFIILFRTFRQKSFFIFHLCPKCFKPTFIKTFWCQISRKPLIFFFQKRQFSSLFEIINNMYSFAKFGIDISISPKGIFYILTYTNRQIIKHFKSCLYKLFCCLFWCPPSSEVWQNIFIHYTMYENNCVMSALFIIISNKMCTINHTSYNVYNTVIFSDVVCIFQVYPKSAGSILNFSFLRFNITMCSFSDNSRS